MGKKRQLPAGLTWPLLLRVVVLLQHPDIADVVVVWRVVVVVLLRRLRSNYYTNTIKALAVLKFISLPACF